MSDSSDLPPGWMIAGWGENTTAADWHNVEAGDRLPNDREIMTSAQIVLAKTDAQGVTQYHSIMDGADGWDGLLDYVDDFEEEYG